MKFIWHFFCTLVIFCVVHLVQHEDYPKDLVYLQPWRLHCIQTQNSSQITVHFSANFMKEAH